MRKYLGSAAKSFGIEISALLLFWVLCFALIQAASRWLGGWPLTEVAQLVGSAVGVAIAVRFRARLVAYFLSGVLAFTLAELAIHSLYGLRSVQGGPTHFAVLAAAVVGVVLGAGLTVYFRRTERSSEEHLSTASQRELAA